MKTWFGYKNSDEKHLCNANMMLASRDPNAKDFGYYFGQAWENTQTQKRFFLDTFDEEGAVWKEMNF